VLASLGPFHIIFLVPRQASYAISFTLAAVTGRALNHTDNRTIQPNGKTDHFCVVFAQLVHAELTSMVS